MEIDSEPFNMEQASKRPLPSSEGESDSRLPPPKNPKKNKATGKSTSIETPKKNDKAKEKEKEYTADSAVQKVETTKYAAYTKAPFIVHFRIPNPGKEKRRRTSLLLVAKKLHSANVKFINLREYSIDTWVATFPSKAAANLVLSNKYVNEMGFKAFIPAYKLARRFVIKNIPMEFSLEEIKQAIEDENSEILIQNIFRLKRKDRNTNLWVDSESICIHKYGEDIPDRVIIMKTINPVFPYFAAVRMCYKCGFYGHLKKYCEKESRCMQCSETDHQSSKECPCLKSKMCINCKGQHATTDRKCPMYVRNVEIAKIMAQENLPFFEAKRKALKLEKNSSKDTLSPFPSLKEFPNLPQKHGITLVDSPASLQNSSRQHRQWNQVARSNTPELNSRITKIFNDILTTNDLDLEDICNRIEKILQLKAMVKNHEKPISSSNI